MENLKKSRFSGMNTPKMGLGRQKMFYFNVLGIWTLSSQATAYSIMLISIGFKSLLLYWEGIKWSIIVDDSAAGCRWRLKRSVRIPVRAGTALTGTDFN